MMFKSLAEVSKTLNPQYPEFAFAWISKYWVLASGHSASIYQDHMIIFAGIHEVTHELDDMAAYNFKTNKWVHLFSEPII